MPKVRVNGIETYYYSHGEGTPVLFIHGGFAGTMTQFLQKEPPADQPALLYRLRPEDPIKLINYDRRCCRHSEYVLEEFTLEDLAADARALLEYLEIERSIVIGDSGGGPVALQYALQYPHHVSAVGLVETDASGDFGFLDPATDENLRKMGEENRELVARLRTEGARAVFESRKEQLRSPPPPVMPSDASRLPEEAVRRFWEQHLASLREASDEELYIWSTGSLRGFGAFLGRDLTPRLSELKMPVCIIHGAADTMVPIKSGEALQRSIPHSEFHAIDGAGHGLLMQREALHELRAWVLRMADAETERVPRSDMAFPSDQVV